MAACLRAYGSLSFFSYAEDAAATHGDVLGLIVAVVTVVSGSFFFSSSVVDLEVDLETMDADANPSVQGCLIASLFLIQFWDILFRFFLLFLFSFFQTRLIHLVNSISFNDYFFHFCSHTFLYTICTFIIFGFASYISMT